MLECNQIEKKIYDLAAGFQAHFKAKRYFQAKYCYEQARQVTVFVELEEEKKRELFGERGIRGGTMQEGLFKEEWVQKAYLECCVKGKEQSGNCQLCVEYFQN